MEENGAAPLISNNEFENFSFLNDANLQGVKIDSNSISFNNINNDIINSEQNVIEEKEREKDDSNEFKKYNFQKGDFVTPLGDNDNNIENSNNLNSKSKNLSTSSIIVNTLETPQCSKNNKNNLENSSSSQSTNKSSSLNTPLSHRQLNNISNETLSPQKETEGKPTNTPKKRKRKNSKSKTKSRNKIKLEGIRKKIKSRLLKNLKILYNKKLLESNSQMFFDFFPQSFITDVSIINNKSYLNLTMRNLLTKIFGTRAKDKEKLSINKKVLNYLDANPDIRIKSGIDDFLNSYYKDVIKEYVEGKLFEEDIIKLRKEKESEDYIKKYVDIAKNLVEFYESSGPMKIKTKS